MGYDQSVIELHAKSHLQTLGKQLASKIADKNLSHRQIFLNTGVDYNSIKKILNGENVEILTYLKVLEFVK